MTSRLFQYMDVGDKRDEFNAACDECLTSKYILAEGKLSALLQVIASSKQMYDLFSGLLKDFDFAEQFKKSRGEQGGRFTLELPPLLGERAAYIFCLLLSIDTRETDFKLFLHTFFGGDNAGDEYLKFAALMIVAFKNCVNRLLSGDDVKTDLAAFCEKEKDDVKTDAEYLNNVAAETLLSCAGDLTDCIRRDQSANAEDREEVLLVADALLAAIKSRVKKSVRVMFISLKAVLKACVIPETELMFEDFIKLLKEYRVL